MLNVALPLQNRMVIRGAINPLDKATIVSIYPKPIIENKWTLFPGHWEMGAGTYENPAILVVGPSSWFFDKDEESPIVEIPVGAIQIAESIVKDYCGSVLEGAYGEGMPGVFFIAGELTLPQIKTAHKNRLDHALLLQKTWFSKLVRVADSLWARTNGNPISISDDMRMAALELGLDKPWMADFHAVAMTKCFACGNLKNPEYPVCPTCKVVDPSHSKSKDLKFAS